MSFISDLLKYGKLAVNAATVSAAGAASQSDLVPLAAFAGAAQAAGRPCWPANASWSDTVMTARIARVLVNGGAAIRLVYVGSYKDGTGEGPLINPVHVKAGLEYPIGTIRPVTFDGKLAGTLVPNGWLISDPVGIGAAPGDIVYERTMICPPMAPAIGATASTSGGVLSAATYFYKVCAITDGGGESLASSEVSVTTTGSTSSVTLSIADRNPSYVPVLSYNIYRATSTGAETLIATIKATDRTWTDTGAGGVSVSTTISASATTRQPSVVSTAGFKVGDKILINGATAATILQVNGLSQIVIDANLTVTAGQTVVLNKTPPTTTTSISNLQIRKDLFANEGIRNGLDMAHGDLGGFSFIAGDSGVPAAMAVLASPAKPSAAKPAIALIGDSIMNGTGWCSASTAGRGFGTYALNNLFPYVNVSVGGDLGSSFTQLTHSAARMVLVQFCAYAISDYGINDLGASNTADQLKATTLAIARKAINCGLVFYQTTLIPQAGSTDGWQTVSGQTPGSHETYRQTFNQWLRAPASAGTGNSFLADLGDLAIYAGVFDTAAQIECNADGSAIQISSASGAITNGAGGRFKVYDNTHYDSNSGTISGTTTTLTDSGKAWATNQWSGYMLAKTTSGATEYLQVSTNTTTTVTMNGTWSSAPTSASTYYIYKGPSIDGTHPSDFAHMDMSLAVDTSKFV